ncbi:hypothetical protein ACHBTE_13135 [Streptomyces sp. M41]|uniref:hypothetical protein n=1 Tax=Streptomyces sp. M41 TaxID=3059412 RepID=UPI00374CC0A5
MFGGRWAVVVLVAGVLAVTGCSSENGDDGDGSAAKPSGPVVSTSTTAPVSASPGSTPPGSPAPAPPASHSSSAPASPTGAASPVPVSGPDQELVTMVVTGGFAGVRKQVTLRGDGTLHTDDKGERAVRRAGPADFTELRTLLGDPALDGVSDLTRNMEAADLFQYTLRFDGRTVVTDRSAEEPALDRLIEALSAWLPDR